MIICGQDFCFDLNYLEAYVEPGSECSVEITNSFGLWEGSFSTPANTGANMTIGVNTPILDQFSDGGQIGAFYDLDGDGTLECIGREFISQGFFGLALWGDDSSTPEKDGLASDDVPVFAILYQGAVFDLYEIPVFWGYITNSIWNITEVVFSAIYGCMNPIAINYNIDANREDGVCQIEGCTYFNSINYNSEANVDDGSCIVEGCNDETACNTIEILDYVTYIDDGSCIYPQEFYNCNGECINDIDEDQVCDELEIPGCQDDNYIEYNPNATDEDGSCSFTWKEGYLMLIEQPHCEQIEISFDVGWNMFGYTSSIIEDVSVIMAPHNDYIQIIKDNHGDQYWPSYNFNGIGDFIPGEGYQIRLNESFSIFFEN